MGGGPLTFGNVPGLSSTEKKERKKINLHRHVRYIFLFFTNGLDPTTYIRNGVDPVGGVDGRLGGGTPNFREMSQA